MTLIDGLIGLPTPTAYAQTAARTVSVGFIHSPSSRLRIRGRKSARSTSPKVAQSVVHKCRVLDGQVLEVATRALVYSVSRHGVASRYFAQFDTGTRGLQSRMRRIICK
jgi:hypothetical protein